MTGSVGDADDICQEAWIRWQRTDRASIRSPEAWLVTTTTRLSIDRLRSAARQKETYVGPWLPEPLPDDMARRGSAVATGAPPPQPEEAAELADSLTFGFLTMLDELSPNERAALLLHDVFGHDFDATAAAIGTSSANARQIASRARQKLRAAPTRESGSGFLPAPSADIQAKLETLLGALALGDSNTVLSLMAEDVVQIDDGGPTVRAARHPIVGRERVTRFLLNLTRRALGTNPEPAIVESNGAPAFLMARDGEPWFLMTISLNEAGEIHRIWAQLNPEKLRHLGAAGGAGSGGSPTDQAVPPGGPGRSDAIIASRRRWRASETDTW
jgi:RNA polymerase sigma-70 factor (ECF subfamily)